MVHVSLFAAFPIGHQERKDGSAANRTLEVFQGVLMNNTSYKQWKGQLNARWYQYLAEAIEAMRKETLASLRDRFAFVLVTDGNESEAWFPGLRQRWPKNARLVLAISNPENFSYFASQASEDYGILSVDCTAVLGRSRVAHGALEYLALRVRN